MPASKDKLGELYVEVSAELGQLRKDFTKLKQDAKKQGFGIGKGFGSSLAAGIGSVGVITGLVMALKSGFSELRKFDKAMRNVNSIMGISNSELKAMSSGVRELALSLGADATDLANGLYQAASAGVAAGDALEFLEVATKAGIAGLSSTETAVDGLTTVMNAFKFDASDAGQVADVMFQTVKLGKTTFDQLSASMSNVAPIAAASGVSFQEVSGAIASLTKQGTPTAVATNQIRAAILAMNKELGDGWTATMSFNEAAEEMRKRAGGSNVKLQEMVGRIEGVNAILGVTGENALVAANDFDAMGVAGGAAGVALEEQMKSVDSQLNIVWGQIKEVAYNFAELLLPAIEGAIDGFKWLNNQLKTFIGMMKWSDNIAAAKAVRDKETKSDLDKMADSQGALNKALKEGNKEKEKSNKITLKKPPVVTPTSTAATTTPELTPAQKSELDKEAYLGELKTQAFLESEQRKLSIAQAQSDERIRIQEEEEAERAALVQRGTQIGISGFTSMLSSMTRLQTNSNNALVKGFTNMANMFINEVNRMIAQWLMFQAVTLAGGTPGFANPFAAFGQHGGKFVGRENAPRRAQHGADIKVPTGFNNDSFPLRVESGEEVSVTSRGRTSNQEALLGELINRVEAMNTNIVAGSGITSGGRDRQKDKAIPVVGKIDGFAITLTNDKAAKRIKRYR